jgi:carbonic anhydrase
VLEGEAFLDAVVRTNILSTMHAIREQSPLLWNLEQNDMIKIVACIYHLDSGKVEWLKQ